MEKRFYDKAREVFCSCPHNPSDACVSCVSEAFDKQYQAMRDRVEGAFIALIYDGQGLTHNQRVAIRDAVAGLP